MRNAVDAPRERSRRLLFGCGICRFVSPLGPRPSAMKDHRRREWTWPSCDFRFWGALTQIPATRAVIGKAVPIPSSIDEPRFVPTLVQFAFTFRWIDSAAATFLYCDFKGAPPLVFGHAGLASAFALFVNELPVSYSLNADPYPRAPTAACFQNANLCPFSAAPRTRLSICHTTPSFQLGHAALDFE